MRPKRRRRRRLLLSRKTFLLCAVAGVLVGGFMIWAHFGPGIRPLPQPNTPGNRNIIRTASVEQIAQALQSYFHDNGSLPYALPTTPTQICTDMGANCASQHFADLGYLMTEGDYLPGIPEDPTPVISFTRWDSGYYIAKVGPNQVEISAPRAELGKTISDTVQL